MARSYRTSIRKLPKVLDALQINVGEYPSYFNGYICNFEIDTRPYTDDCYHDAPNSITINMTVEDLKNLREKVEKAIKEAEEIAIKYEYRKEEKGTMEKE